MPRKCNSHVGWPTGAQRPAAPIKPTHNQAVTSAGPMLNAAGPSSVGTAGHTCAFRCRVFLFDVRFFGTIHIIISEIGARAHKLQQWGVEGRSITYLGGPGGS